MLRYLIAAACVLTPAAASAHRSVVLIEGGYSAWVDYSDLNLGSPAGQAALKNRMQATVNIAMGASLSTVILTVPVMEAIALYTGQPFIMAMTPVQTVMVTITLIAAAINLNDGETNAIEGMTHFILFATFVMLTALGL